MTEEFTQHDWDVINHLVLKVSRELAAKWEVVEVDDVHQEIMMHFVEQRSHLAQFRDDEDFLRRVAWKSGKAYASKEQNYRDLVDDQYYYTPDEARQILRTFEFSDEEIGRALGKRDDLTSCRVTDNITTARLDALAGMSKLVGKYQEVIQKIFVQGIPPADDAEKRMSYRAVDALAIAMNRNHRKGK